MDPERWKEVESIVAAALELPDEDRGTYLAEFCADDRELRAEVEDLLAGRSGAAGFLESAVRESIDETTSTVPPSKDPLLGSVIGSYRLEDLIGAGGMGAVYLATRADEEYQQQVALKLLHAGAASRELMRRFRAERQILAVLDHPNIARLLDGGTNADGRPYLVMEYVDGAPLDRYCDEHELGVRQRLDLFLKVCGPVAFAHRRLVVHRDLKPSNILVGRDGEPKLLDFGIAKLLDPAAIPGGDEATRTGFRPMSPAFASPEQIRGRSITTSSDVYSLGVVLYKLLAGTLPHRFVDLSPLAMDRELDRDPTAPSAAVGGDTVSAAKVRRRLRGDLDAIVLKALREEPEQRYASVDELAEDLRRHLAGLPVMARRGTAAYRAGRYLGRHKVAVAVTAIVMTVAIGSAIALGLQAKRIATERDKAQQIAEFLAQLFRASAPMEAGGGEPTLRVVVDNGADRVRTELDGQPEIQSALLGVLGGTYFQLGLYNEAESILLESIEVSRSASITANPTIAPALNHLAAIYLDGDDLDKTQALVERALEIGRRGVPGDPFALPDSLSLMGDLMHQRGDDARALEYYRQALEIARETHGENDPYYAYRLIYLAAGLRRMGFTEAEAHYLSALEIQEAALEPDDPMVMMTLRSLGDYYFDRQRLARGLEVLAKALVIGERQLGPDHPEVGGIHLRLAKTYIKRGEILNAEPHAVRGWAITEQHRSPTSPAMASAWQVTADLQLARGELEETLELLTQTLAANIANHGLENRRTITVEQKIALVEHFGGGGREGMNKMKTALAALEAVLPADHPDLARAHARAASIYLGTESAAEAEVPLRRAMGIWRTKGYDRSAQYAAAGFHLAMALTAAGRMDEAPIVLSDASATLEELSTDDPCPRYTQLMAEAKIAEGEIYATNGDNRGTIAALTEALRLLALNPEGSIGADHHLIAGKALLGLGRSDEVEPHARYLAERGWRWPDWVQRYGHVVE